MTYCSQHNFKSPKYSRVIMPNDNEGNDESPRVQAASGGHHQGRHGRNQRRQGNRSVEYQRGRQPKFEGREPRLQGHIYDWTGERSPERYIRTTRKVSTYVGVAIQNTLPILLQQWTLLNLPTQRSPWHQTQPTLWHLSDGNMYIRNI